MNIRYPGTIEQIFEAIKIEQLMRKTLKRGIFQIHNFYCMEIVYFIHPNREVLNLESFMFAIIIII